MKKYNLSNIMKRAWSLVKETGATISEGLKKAWNEAKKLQQKIKFNGKASIAKIENGKTSPYVGTEYDSESNYLYFSLWEKYGKKRIYINDYKMRSVGYIDCMNENKIYASTTNADETAKYFLESYVF